MKTFDFLVKSINGLRTCGTNALELMDKAYDLQSDGKRLASKLDRHILLARYEEIQSKISVKFAQANF